MTGISIASLNLRFGISPKIELPYDVTAAIASLDADVVALQEAWRPKHGPAAHEIAAAELGYQVVELALPRAHNKSSPPLVRDLDGMHGTWWGVAVLSRLPIVDRFSFDFAPIRFDAAGRRALVATIETPWNARLAIVTPHLTYRLWGSVNHLRALARHGRTIADEAVILGDFNMWGPVVDRFVPGWQRPVRGRTWPGSRPHSQIDHILVSQGLVVRDARVLPAIGSDHLPVRVTLDAPRHQ
jgi:endonuclease/exonuclease/phosphatase family metal-dependent hydrolase